MIPQIGVESAPADLATWSLASFIRQKLSVSVREVVLTIQDINFAVSGGTSLTVLSAAEHYSIKQIRESMAAYALPPMLGPNVKRSKTFVEKVFGIRTLPDLGTVGTAFSANADRSQVYRSWRLLGGEAMYGPKFAFNEYMKYRNIFIAAAMRFALVFAVVAIVVPPIR
jgi:hypothetical protein